MLTVKECLDTVKVRKYIVFSGHDVVGFIIREKVDDGFKFIFSNDRLLDYLNSDVSEIIPKYNTCNLVIDIGLPFDC